MSFPISGTLLDGCVLAILSRGDAYGYRLTQSLQAAVQISESTLYPVLRRLQKEHCLEAYDRPYAGRNRRYYRLTETGRGKLSQTQREWAAFQAMVDDLLLTRNRTDSDEGETEAKAADSGGIIPLSAVPIKGEEGDG